LIKNILEQFPRSMFIGIGQRRTFRNFHAKLLQPSLTTAQSSDNLSQRLCVGQLTEQHRHKLVPTGKSARMPLRLSRLHLLTKFISRKHLEQLRHDAAKSPHGAEPPG